MPDLRKKLADAEGQSVLSDSDLLALFQQQPEKAWRAFIDKHADTIFSLLRSLGFDYDQAMDRFVYVCEKLTEKNFRRLKAIRYTGSYGDLTPWLRQVVKRLSINWAWSEEGRKRLLKPIAQLGPCEQRVFELYFWNGLMPSVIAERLSQEHFEAASLGSVFQALEEIFSHLSEKKLWRLISNLARSGTPVSLDSVDDENGFSFDPPDQAPDPEQELVRHEDDRRLREALRDLPDGHLLIVQFRFEHALATSEIAEILGKDERDVKSALKESLLLLKRSLK
jgi:RNA polymerase sigma factor (sigma-70 family)